MRVVGGLPPAGMIWFWLRCTLLFSRPLIMEALLDKAAGYVPATITTPATFTFVIVFLRLASPVVPVVTPARFISELYQSAGLFVL